MGSRLRISLGSRFVYTTKTTQTTKLRSGAAVEWPRHWIPSVVHYLSFDSCACPGCPGPMKISRLDRIGEVLSVGYLCSECRRTANRFYELRSGSPLAYGSRGGQGSPFRGPRDDIRLWCQGCSWAFSIDSVEWCRDNLRIHFSCERCHVKVTRLYDLSSGAFLFAHWRPVSPV